MDIKIIVATHKKYWMPSDDIYLPVHVGKKGKTDLGYQGDDNDGVNFVFLNATSKVGILKQNEVLRGLGTADIELPAVWAGQQVHCWIYFSSPDGKINSDSQYIDLIQL